MGDARGKLEKEVLININNNDYDTTAITVYGTTQSTTTIFFFFIDVAGFREATLCARGFVKQKRRRTKITIITKE